MSACHAVRQDQRSWSGREHHVHRPLSEVFRDHRAESLGERRLRRHQRLLDVLAGVLAGGQEHVIVGVIGAGALEDLEVDLLANLGLDGGGILLRRGAHRGPSRRPLSHGSAGPLRARARLPAMRVLALETSTRAGGVALVDGERLVAEYVLDISVTHSERLLAAVDRVLADARWTPRDLEGLAVSIGPGSFTGLRIGVSTVKGLGWALGLPIAAVPTLDAMAATVPWAALPVCPVLDARRGEVYASLYRRDGDGLRREATLLVGDGAAGVDSPHARRLPAPRRVPSPACVAVLGRERLRLGDTVGAAELVPLYLRPSQAELRRRAATIR